MFPIAMYKRRQVPTELPPFIFRLSVGQYHRMIDDGILTPDDPVELIEGCLVTKMPKKPLRRLVTRLLREKLEELLPPGWFVDVQEPVTTAASEPEPDVAVIRGKPRDYSKRHPGPKELALVAEVADTTLRSDRALKEEAYARGGIKVYWIVNLVDNQIEVYSKPEVMAESADYRNQKTYGFDDKAPVFVEGRKVGTVVLKDLM